MMDKCQNERVSNSDDMLRMGQEIPWGRQREHEAGGVSDEATEYLSMNQVLSVSLQGFSLASWPGY